MNERNNDEIGFAGLIGFDRSWLQGLSSLLTSKNDDMQGRCFRRASALNFVYQATY
jgi:hypothetical protein